MDERFRRYPIGIQNFEDLRNNGYVYVDKTELIYRLTNTNKVYFLSRPRRFGKSLLVSTLEAYFSGKKDLFNGLAMETLEKEWAVYPVLHIDFSVSKYMTAEALSAVINYQLLQWEKLYGREEGETTFSLRLKGIIQRAYTQTGKPVVILVDEYDAPMLDSNNNTELQIEIRDIMRDFFSPLKAQGQYIRFLFITGISKFSQMSIFSELNNLQNISMWDEYSAICGITEQEVHTLQIDIEQMAQANNETYEEACTHLKQQYDGYHFSENSEDIYNPFSLFNAFAQKKYSNFWFSTGTPTFLIDLLQESNFDIRELDDTTATAEQFDAPTNRITDPLPVLYQSGYLTIKGYDPSFQLYTLAYPNKEVARDIVHDVFLTFWNHREHLDFSWSLKSYLFTLSRNYALNYLRHQKVVAQNEEALMREMESIQDEWEDYDQKIERLQAGLAALPDKQREVLIKCFVEGKKYREIADEMDISLNTVKTHLKRAVHFLREELPDGLTLLFMLKYN